MHRPRTDPLGPGSTACRGKSAQASQSCRRRRPRSRWIDHITQQELADRVGVTRQTILSIERGRYNPSVGLALRLAEAFDVSVEALFELDEEEGHD
ncbi:MAG: helix-turn-helix transcriptional regulator [Gemmatimonadetes bacterium]|nr:helix-turn-helix transcriptional regulator [Gemmatimonadota bacterium]